MTRNWEVSGSYVILENLEFANSPPDDDGLVLLAPLNNAALRFSDVRGNLAGGGLSVTSYTSATATNVVVYGNTIHDNGDIAATFDQDIHGIEVNSDVSNLWVVDNQMYRNSGDGIQINAGSAGSASSLHHVYVGRNVAHHNKQNGFWSKQSTDVIFSQNTSYGHRPGNSSSGAGMGFQYAPERIWFLYNNIFDCELGIYVANDNGLGNGQNSYYIGNLITNIHSSGGFQSGSAYQNAGFVLAGSRNRYLVNNTLYQTDSGIAAPGSAGGLFMSNNIISNLTQAQGSHVFIEQPATASGSTIRNTLFQGTVRIKWGGNSPVYTLASFQSSHPGACGGCRTGEPQFANPGAGDLSLLPGSPAVDTGVADAVYTTFQSLYGISIARDFAGTPRPQGVAWDMGAYERAIPPDVTANDASGTERNFVTSSLGFVVSLSNPSPVPVYVSYATSPGTATAAADYTAVSGTLTVPAGSASAAVPVTLQPDLVDEDNETFTLTLSNPVNGPAVPGRRAHRDRGRGRGRGVRDRGGAVHGLQDGAGPAPPVAPDGPGRGVRRGGGAVAGRAHRQRRGHQRHRGPGGDPGSAGGRDWPGQRVRVVRGGAGRALSRAGSATDRQPARGLSWGVSPAGPGWPPRCGGGPGVSGARTASRAAASAGAPARWAHSRRCR